MADILSFYDTDKDVAHYLDLTQMKELKIPDGYQQVLYREDRTFLLQQGETYRIYDAGAGENGAVFTLDSPPQDVMVLSLDTYVVQEFNNSRIFIHDQEVSPESSVEYAPACPVPIRLSCQEKPLALMMHPISFYTYRFVLLLDLRLLESPILSMIVHPAIRANMTARNSGKISVPITPEIKPKSTGVSIMLRFEKAISIPIRD